MLDGLLEVTEHMAKMVHYDPFVDAFLDIHERGLPAEAVIQEENQP